MCCKVAQEKKNSDKEQRERNVQKKRIRGYRLCDRYPRADRERRSSSVIESRLRRKKISQRKKKKKKTGGRAFTGTVRKTRKKKGREQVGEKKVKKTGTRDKGAGLYAA